MRFLTFALVFAATFSLSTAETFNVKQLVEEAERLGAPFTPTSLHKLNSKTWGSLRSNRTSNVILFNTGSKSFSRKMNYCSQGSPSPGLMPESWFHGGRSVAYGFESTKFRNAMYFGFSPDVFISSVSSFGNSNQIRLVISDQSGGPRLASGQHRRSFSIIKIWPRDVVMSPPLLEAINSSTRHHAM